MIRSPVAAALQNGSAGIFDFQSLRISRFVCLAHGDRGPDGKPAETVFRTERSGIRKAVPCPLLRVFLFYAETAGICRRVL